MRRLLPLLAVLALGATAAACDASLTPYAAKVNGMTVTQTTVKSDLDAIAGNPDLRCLVQSGEAIYGAGGSGTYSATFEASRLAARIDRAVIDQELTKLHSSVTSLAVTTARNDLETQFTSDASSGSCTASGTATVKSFSPELADQITEFQAAEDSLAASLAGEPLTAAGVAAFAKEHPVASAEDCVSWIVTSSVATADRLETSLSQGAAFATVAKASSLDSQSAAAGGAIGCHPLSQFPAPLNTDLPAMTLNTPSKPVALTESGTTYYLIVMVTSRQASTLAATAALLSKGSADETKVVDHLLAVADVDVNPAYGQWEKTEGIFTVVPPKGPPVSLLGNSGALTPPTVTP